MALVNVPNGNTIIEKGMYDQIVCEHINYYTVESLVKLVSKLDFEILKIENDEEAIEINMYIRKPDKEEKESIALKYKNDKNWLNEIVQGYHHIGIWGAGAKTVTFSSLLGDNVIISRFFDNDNKKHGLFVSGVDIAVEQPVKQTVQMCDIILIFAVSYTEIILKELREKFEYKGAIVRLDKKEIVEVYRNSKNE